MDSHGRLVLDAPGDHKQEFNLTGNKITLGRAPNNDIVIQDSKASRTHAQIEFTENDWTLVDLKSTNGTLVNGGKTDRVQLAPGDVITVGKSTLRFEIDMPREETIIEYIHSESELESTLADSVLSMTLSDTGTSRLVVNTAEKTWEIPFNKEAITIGRHPDNDVVLDNPKVSRNHARIVRRGNEYVLRDLQSGNGTWMRKRRIDEYTLCSGDTIGIGDDQLIFKEGFQPEELTIVEPPKSTEMSKRQSVVIVPGLMGTELWLGSEQIWPNVRRLFTRPETLTLPEIRPLEVGQIIHEVVIVPNLIKLDQYNLLGNYLEECLGYERGDNLFEYGYDWRQDVRNSAKLLGKAIEDWRITPPVTLIAHSLGTLVSRYYVEKFGGKDKVDKLILLGGPHSGVPVAISCLVTKADLLPFGLLGERLRDVLATFPSVYQILPTNKCVFDQTGRPINILKEDTWLPEWQRPLLRYGYEFRRELGTQSSVHTISVFGYGLNTVTRVMVKRDSNGQWQKIDYEVDPQGDNRIPEGSAIMQGSDLHPVQQNHGKLFVDNDVKMRLKMELLR